jgi:penicillin-binding protein 2
MLVFDQLKRDDPHLRLLSIAVLGGICVLLGGLWWVQVVKAREYRANLETQSVRTVRIPATRGKILDRNGNALAENRPDYNISLYLEELRDDFQKKFTELRPRVPPTNSTTAWKRWLGLAPSSDKIQFAKLSTARREALTWQAQYAVVSDVVRRISGELQQPLAFSFNQFSNHYVNSRALPCPVAKDIGPVQIARFQEQASNMRGVDMEIQSKRYYPNGPLAAHLLGFLRFDPSSIEGEESYFYYRLPDYRGMIGIEGGFDAELHGRAGAKSVLVNNLGYRQAENIWSVAEPGSNVVLTIDRGIQQASEQALVMRGPFGVNTRGAVVVMDVHTGDVLALASNPTFDPNDYVQGFRADEYRKMQESGAEHNRATGEIYAPGSIFKTIVGLACLEAGLDPNATIYNSENPAEPGRGHIVVAGRSIKDTAPYGLYNFRRAIIRSSNTYFITNGMKVGIEKIVQLAQHLHLGERCDLSTRQDAPGKFPGLKRIQSKWFSGDTALICFGQGEIAVTPLQMAVMTSALANGGNVLWPRIVDHIESQDPMPGEQPSIPYPAGRVRDHLGVSDRSMTILHQAMLGETEDPEGTGKRAVINGMRICGKTGTAQVQDTKNRLTGWNYWFASFAPYEKPKYAVVVMVESSERGSGGEICAPIAHDIYLAIQKSEQIKTRQNIALK